MVVQMNFFNTCFAIIVLFLMCGLSMNDSYFHVYADPFQELGEKLDARSDEP